MAQLKACTFAIQVSQRKQYELILVINLTDIQASIIFRLEEMQKIVSSRSLIANCSILIDSIFLLVFRHISIEMNLSASQEFSIYGARHNKDIWAFLFLGKRTVSQVLNASELLRNSVNILAIIL